MIDTIYFLLEYIIANAIVILDNWFLFLIWGVLIFIICFSVFKILTKKKDEKIKGLQIENKKLKKDLDAAEEFAIHQGVHLKPTGSAASMTSSKIQKKYDK